MTPNKPEKTGTVTAAANRQKIIAGVIVVIILIVIWQLWGMFGGSAAPTPAAPVPGAVKSGPNNISANPPGAPNPTSGAAIPMTAAAPVTKAVTTPNPGNPEILRLQQESQEKFLTTLNDLQFLRLQREVAETNQAIAAAKLATVKSEKDIADILTKPEQTAAAAAAALNTPQFPSSAYGPSLINPAAGGQTVLTPQTAQTANQPATATLTPLPPAPARPSAAIPVTPAGYVVVSVSMQFNRWSAVLGFQGKLYQVRVGDVMPVDGSRVVSINRSGVVLKRDGNTKTISLVPAI